MEMSLQTLGDELARQQRRQRELEAELSALRERFAASLEPGAAPDDEPPPPHY